MPSAFFHEFVTGWPGRGQIAESAGSEDILGGLPLGGNSMLWCATEMNTQEEMDRAAAVVREVLKA